jgi:Domain of unknown function (DUF4277)
MPSALSSSSYVPERLDHLGIVAGVCREIGLAEWLDAQDEHTHERVSDGTATVAMILNGLGFSNRRLYLVPQFFATKPVEHLLGPPTPCAPDCSSSNTPPAWARSSPLSNDGPAFLGRSTCPRRCCG